MNSDRIAELRALEAAASRGPWEKIVDAKLVLAPPYNDAGTCNVMFLHDDSTVAEEADYAFIAAARTALPEALDAIERARALKPWVFAGPLSSHVDGPRDEWVKWSDVLAALDGKA